MKKNSFLILMMILLICISNSCKKPNKQTLININDADKVIVHTLKELNETANFSNPVPQLNQNVWQYIFRTAEIPITVGDTWYVHKAWDAANKSVCFIIESVPQSGGSTRYYMGYVECPSICGYATGHLDPSYAAVYFTHPPLKHLATKEDAQNYMNNPQKNCVTTITIDWNQDAWNLYNNNGSPAQLLQIVVGNSPGEPDPQEAFMYCLDKTGAVLGENGVKATDLCVYQGPDDCSLK